MDYEKAAQDLFERLLSLLARQGEAAAFGEICEKYPQLLAKFECRVEEEAAKIKLPDDFKDRMRENMRKIMDAEKEKK